MSQPNSRVLTGGFRLANLKAIRKQNGKTQEQVARDLDIPVGTYRNWEQQKNNPQRENLQNLATYFNCTIDDLIITGSEPGNPKWNLVPVPLYLTDAFTNDTYFSAHDPDSWPDDEWVIPSEMKSKYPNSFLYLVNDVGIDRVLPIGSYALIDVDFESDISGKVCLVCVGKNEAKIRRVRILENGIELEPNSISDPTCHTEVYDSTVEGTETVTIIGRVVWYTIPYDFEI